MDEVWTQYQNAAWKIAHSFAKAFGGRGSDYIGSVWLKMRLAYTNWQPVGGRSFLSYFCALSFQQIIRDFYRYESEYLNLRFTSGGKPSMLSQQEVQVTNVNFAYHEAEYYLYRIPEKDDEWVDEVLGCFATPLDCWQYLLIELAPRDRFILGARFQDLRSLEDIGKQLGITRERTRQIEARALGKIKTHLEQVEKFARLFV